MDKVEGQEEAGGSHLCSVNISKGDESELPFSQQKSPAGEVPNFAKVLLSAKMLVVGPPSDCSLVELIWIVHR